MTFQLYEALGVPKNASKEEIKKAYKLLAVKHHPDKGGDSEKFKEISHAYQILSDDEKRRRYDQLGDEHFENGGMGGGGGMNPHDIFAQMFGNMDMDFMFHGGAPPGARAIRKRGNIEHVFHMNLADAYHGRTKNLRIVLQHICRDCREMCHGCQGRGSVTDMRRMGFFTQMMTRPCHQCQGSGKIAKGRPECAKCKGTSQYTEEARCEVKIPAGVPNGHTITIPNLGEQPQDENEIAGDLVLQILISNDPHFQRNGTDLVYRVPISYAESILGKKIVIPHFGGDFEMDLSNYTIIRPERPYMIDGKGMPTDDNKTQYGKLVVIFQIHYPTRKWTEEEKGIWREVLQRLQL